MDSFPEGLLTYGDARDVSVLIADSAELVRREVQRWHTDNSVRVVRGFRMRDWSSLMDEFSAAFQFPLYFGGNLDALNESLSEPDQEPLRESRI